MKDILKDSLAGLMVSFVMVPLTLIALTGLAGPAAHARTTPGPLVSVQQLQGLIQAGKVVVLDTRELLQTDQKTPNFTAGHIPGAQPLPYSLFRGPKESPGAVVPIATLEKILSPLGMKTTDPIVLLGSGSDATEFGGVARVYWTLKAAGFKDLAILDGGLGAWMAAKLPLESGQAKPRSPRTGDNRLQYNPSLLLSTPRHMHWPTLSLGCGRSLSMPGPRTSFSVRCAIRRPPDGAPLHRPSGSTLRNGSCPIQGACFQRSGS